MVVGSTTRNCPAAVLGSPSVVCELPAMKVTVTLPEVWLPTVQKRKV